MENKDQVLLDITQVTQMDEISRDKWFEWVDKKNVIMERPMTPTESFRFEILDLSDLKIDEAGQFPKITGPKKKLIL